MNNQSAIFSNIIRAICFLLAGVKKAAIRCLFPAVKVCNINFVTISRSKSTHCNSLFGFVGTVNRKRKVQDTSSGTHTDPASTSSPASDAVVKSSATAPELPHDPSKWSAEDVVTYISCSDPSLSGYADLFQRHVSIF